MILFSTVLLFVILTVKFYYKWKFNYWRRKKIPTLPPKIPFGNLPNPLKQQETTGVHIKLLYDQIKDNGWKHAGLYFLTRPVYMVVDLEYVKNILTKDFQHFVDRGFYFNEKDDPISAHVFAIGGQKWRNLRTKLTPTFTSGKMKQMFQTLLECKTSLLKRVDKEHQTPINIKEILGCFTTDIIGSCAFGLDCNTFKEEDSPFRKYGKKVFESNLRRRLQIFFFTHFPSLARALKVRHFSKDVADFFTKVVKDTVNYREENNYTRKDFMQLLIELKNSKTGLTLDEIAAQSLIFFLAGFETSATTMTFALFELAKNQEIQQKVREEIGVILGDDKITYEALQKMKFLTQVINETLRKYPPLSFLTRECVKDYKIPDQDVIIEKGTKVVISILGLHRDEDYFPDPEKFDPGRFSEDNTGFRDQFAYIPFGEGPRICIGLRFGMMQTKVGLVSLLRKFKFTVNRKTREPIKFDVKGFILAAEGDIWLNAQKVC
ncbi:cytochrome P450 6a2-like [Tribolium madens]|uniref:cytochrome P450 6a2-like n=1 Tax=Tribolium madens TaxID=41895 RepID=UPI001CF7489B|nr:cytochrome P450 6a2-like [Tribolium madens]